MIDILSLPKQCKNQFIIMIPSKNNVTDHILGKNSQKSLCCVSMNRIHVVELAYGTVVISKSSGFLKRTSNFLKFVRFP